MYSSEPNYLYTVYMTIYTSLTIVLGDMPVFSNIVKISKISYSIVMIIGLLIYRDYYIRTIN